eukprot:2398163-Prymnesium_polylepis.1
MAVQRHRPLRLTWTRSGCAKFDSAPRPTLRTTPYTCSRRARAGARAAHTRHGRPRGSRKGKGYDGGAAARRAVTRIQL